MTKLSQTLINLWIFLLIFVRVLLVFFYGNDGSKMVVDFLGYLVLMFVIYRSHGFLYMLILLSNPILLWPNGFMPMMVVACVHLALIQKRIAEKIIFIVLGALAFLYSGVIEISIQKDIGIINSINDFRGGLIEIGQPLIAKILHNKIQYVPVVLGQAISYLSPGFLFITGDNNVGSISFAIPPMLNIYLYFVATGLLKIRWNKYGIAVLVYTVILGLRRFPQTEDGVYLLSIPISMIVKNTFLELKTKQRLVLNILIIVNLILLTIFTINLGQQ